MNLLSNSRQQTGTQKYVVQPPLRIKGDNWQTMFGLSMCVCVRTRFCHILIWILHVCDTCPYWEDMHVCPNSNFNCKHLTRTQPPCPICVEINGAGSNIYVRGHIFRRFAAQNTFFRYDTLIYRIVSYRKRVFCAPTLHNGPLVSAEVACL